MNVKINYLPSIELTLVLNSATLGCQHRKINNFDIPWLEVDWQKVLKLANFHGLSCWLAEYLKDSPQVPDEIIYKLTQKKRKQLLSNLFTEQKKCQLVMTLKQANIRFAILKGVAIANQLYQQRWYYRSISDLDILIDPQQLAKAFELIKNLGYLDSNKGSLNTKDFKIIATDHQKLAMIERSLVLPNRLLTLDIHWKLKRHSLMPLQNERLFDEIEYDSSDTPRLNQSLEFIYICVHGMNDGWRSLKGVVDILYYAEHVEDWSEIYEMANQLGLSHIINTSLAVCDFFFATHYAPKHLNKREKTLWTYTINGFARDDEFPCVHSYLNNSSVYQFTKTTLSWSLAISSELVSNTVAIKGISTLNHSDEGILLGGNQRYYGIFIKVFRVIKKYYLAKYD